MEAYFFLNLNTVEYEPEDLVFGSQCDFCGSWGVGVELSLLLRC